MNIETLGCFKVRFIRVSELIQELLRAESEYRLPRYLKTWNKFDLVILDELGYINLGSGSPTHHAHVIPFVGESYRFKESKQNISLINSSNAYWLNETLTARTAVTIFADPNYQQKS